MKNITLSWVTRTAVLTALLIVFQWALGTITGDNQFVVGSAVNLVLIITAVLSGLASGITVALISPFIAYLLGIGIIGIVPFIALGNITIVVVWYYIAGKASATTDGYVRMSAALVIGAALKFIVLYLTIVKFAIPVILNLPAAKVNALSLAFGWPQLVTAAIGGVIAILIIPVLRKAIKLK
jgi:hypothetical protein